MDNIYHKYYMSGTNPPHNPVGLTNFILPTGETEAKSSEARFPRSRQL